MDLWFIPSYVYNVNTGTSRIYGDNVMATAPQLKEVALGVAEIDMVRQALRSYRKVLERQASSELNSQVVELRKQSISFLDTIIGKF